jgi:hypothetical protein
MMAKHQVLNWIKAADQRSTKNPVHSQPRYSFSHCRMPTRCFNRFVRWCVLFSYLLVVGAASASPWFNDVGLGAICRGAASSGPSASEFGAETPANLSLDCAQCLPLQAPPSRQFSPLAHAAPHAQWRLSFHTPFFGPHQQTLPPVRGPPFA